MLIFSALRPRGQPLPHSVLNLDELLDRQRSGLFRRDEAYPFDRQPFLVHQLRPVNSRLHASCQSFGESFNSSFLLGFSF